MSIAINKLSFGLMIRCDNQKEVAQVEQTAGRRNCITVEKQGEPHPIPYSWVLTREHAGKYQVEKAYLKETKPIEEHFEEKIRSEALMTTLTDIFEANEYKEIVSAKDFLNAKRMERN